MKREIQVKGDLTDEMLIYSYVFKEGILEIEATGEQQ